MAKTNTRPKHAQPSTAGHLRSHDLAALRQHLLTWYRANRRNLPWRRSRDPYAIWVSEIMLQQTRVAVVVERYLEFLTRFPTVTALAAADEQQVLALWSGLGYYRRARMLHRAAQMVAAELGGAMPVTAQALRQLPGVGAYTSAAVASIAHGEAVAVVDGNVERVLCRLAGWSTDGAQSAGTLRGNVESLAAELVDPVNAGDFNQAMMELGATVCLPRNPQCLICPVAAHCKTLGEHRTAPRAPMVSREAGHALVVRRRAGADEVLLEQRPAQLTVMPGLWQLPALNNLAVPETDLRMTVRHAIMQVNYVVRIRTMQEPEVPQHTVAGGTRQWVPAAEAAGMALTGLARKVLARAQLIPAARHKAGRNTAPLHGE